MRGAAGQHVAGRKDDAKARKMPWKAQAQGGEQGGRGGEDTRSAARARRAAHLGDLGHALLDLLLGGEVRTRRRASGHIACLLVLVGHADDV